MCSIWYVRCMVFALACSMFASQTLRAAAPYSEGWDAGTTNGWGASTTSSVVVRDGTDGNPAASLAVRRDLSPPVFDMGVTSDLAAVSGDYTTSSAWKFAFDTKYDVGKYNETQLRFRFQDSTFNGWHLTVANVGTGFPNSFVSNTVMFNSNWTSAEATAAGWQDETGGTISWQQLMSNVYHPEIRFVMGDTNSAIAHVDNINLSAVPEPASAVLASLGLVSSLLVMRRRRG